LNDKIKNMIMSDDVRIAEKEYLQRCGFNWCFIIPILNSLEKPNFIKFVNVNTKQWK
jgi:hypothetical protein